MQKLKAKMTKFKRNKELKQNNPLLYNLKNMYIKDYGKSDIYSYTDLEDNLYQKILSVESEKELRELALHAKLQMECRERNNILAGGGLCLSLLAMVMSFFSIFAKTNDAVNEIALLILGIIVFAMIFVNMIVKYHSYDRYVIPYYKLKLECIEKVQKEKRTFRRKRKDKYKAKRKEVEM